MFLFLLGFSLPSDVAYKARTLFGAGHPFGKRSVSSYKDARPSLSSDDTLARSDRCTYSNSSGIGTYLDIVGFFLYLIYKVTE